MKAPRWTLLVVAAALAMPSLGFTLAAHAQTPQPSPSPESSEPPPPPPPSFPEKPKEDRDRQRQQRQETSKPPASSGTSSTSGSTTASTDPSSTASGDAAGATTRTTDARTKDRKKKQRRPAALRQVQPTPTFAPLAPVPAAQPVAAEGGIPVWLLLLLGASLAANLGVVGWLISRRYSGLDRR